MEEVTITCDEHHQHVVTKNELEMYWEEFGKPRVETRDEVELFMSMVVERLHALSN